LHQKRLGSAGGGDKPEHPNVVAIINVEKIGVAGFGGFSVCQTGAASARSSRKKKAKQGIKAQSESAQGKKLF